MLVTLLRRRTRRDSAVLSNTRISQPVLRETNSNCVGSDQVGALGWDIMRNIRCSRGRLVVWDPLLAGSHGPNEKGIERDQVNDRSHDGSQRRTTNVSVVEHSTGGGATATTQVGWAWRR